MQGLRTEVVRKHSWVGAQVRLIKNSLADRQFISLCTVKRRMRRLLSKGESKAAARQSWRLRETGSKSWRLRETGSEHTGLEGRMTPSGAPQQGRCSSEGGRLSCVPGNPGLSGRRGCRVWASSSSFSLGVHLSQQSHPCYHQGHFSSS